MSDAQGGTTTSSYQAKLTVWNRWITYCTAFDIIDPDLSLYSNLDWYRIALSFITYTQRARLCKGSSSHLKKVTIWKIIEDIREILEIQGLGSTINLFIDNRGKLCHIISKILKSYQVKDPKVQRKSPITPSMLRHIKKKAKSERFKFIANLITRVFFFVIRSCEYLKTPSSLS